MSQAPCFTQSPTEQVVLIDDHARAVGVATKAEVHHQCTPLHLAFSCHLVDEHGRTLVTRRALSKATWPGVWTNSFCGHPAPGEDPMLAVHRRARTELGIEIHDVELVLPDFRYRAVDASGVVENEICPVYRAHTGGIPEPDPTEVAQWLWVNSDDLRQAAAAAPFAFSPWLVAQLPLLAQFDQAQFDQAQLDGAGS